MIGTNIDAVLMGNFFYDPSLFLNQNFGQTRFVGIDLR